RRLSTNLGRGLYRLGKPAQWMKFVEEIRDAGCSGEPHRPTYIRYIRNTSRRNQCAGLPG
ncbi:MAG: hypothetical protein VXZ63_07480, partial [Planctomycetota bacterium]|nr:hypothetical protein [Planctomycetota bacterium]